MKALSIHQPWAWAILHAGKTIENRTWPTKHRGPLLIHASKSKASYDREQKGWQERYGCELPAWDGMIVGAVVGVVELVDCVQLAKASRAVRLSRWAEGPFCWVLANPRPLETPIPFRGLQQLFDVPVLDLIPASCHQPDTEGALTVTCRPAKTRD